MKLNSSTMKFIGGALIVVTAFSILMPGLLKFLFGIWRIGVWIITAVILAWLMAYIYSQLIAKKKYENDKPDAKKSDSNDDAT